MSVMSLIKDPHRRTWNAQQHLLQNSLSRPEKYLEWRSLFLSQHAQVHSHRMSNSGEWSFEDEVLDGMDDITVRAIPPTVEHSIVWILWHLARIEDVTMNILVAGTEQLFEREGWKEKMSVLIIDTGNEIDRQQVARLSEAVVLENLKAYRVAVGKRTCQIVSLLTPQALVQKVDPEHVQKVRLSGAVIPAAGGIIDYWSRRTIAGILLMPPTRHCFLHLNEALHIKKALHRAKPNGNI